MKSKVYHGGKPEGMRQLVETANKTAVGTSNACSGSIQWRNDRQYADNVMVGNSWNFPVAVNV